MMRVALIKTGALGDVVQTTALLPGLLRMAPQVSVTWFTSAQALPLIESHPDIAAVVPIDGPGFGMAAGERYDWVISLDDGLRECEFASGISAPRLSGAYLSSTGRREYTPDLEEWFGMGLLRPETNGGLKLANELKRQNQESYQALLYRGLGLPPPLARPQVYVEAERLQSARRWLTEHLPIDRAPVVGLNTGAGSRWRYKRWGIGQTIELARRLHDELEANVVLLGGADEDQRNRHIAAISGRRGVIAAPPCSDLRDFAARICQLDVLVSSDSLAMHLGVALGVYCVAFFGPTSAAEIDFYSRGERVVTPLACRCCYRSTCDVRPDCMSSISVEAIFGAVMRSICSEGHDRRTSGWSKDSERPESTSSIVLK